MKKYFGGKNSKHSHPTMHKGAELQLHKQSCCWHFLIPQWSAAMPVEDFLCGIISTEVCCTHAHICDKPVAANCDRGAEHGSVGARSVPQLSWRQWECVLVTALLVLPCSVTFPPQFGIMELLLSPCCNQANFRVINVGKDL